MCNNDYCRVFGFNQLAVASSNRLYHIGGYFIDFLKIQLLTREIKKILNISQNFNSGEHEAKNKEIYLNFWVVVFFLLFSKVVISISYKERF